MNIVNKKPDMVEFGSLSSGSVFKDKHANYCMKTEKYSSSVNMIYLSDGVLDHIEDCDMVERIRCQLVVE